MNLVMRWRRLLLPALATAALLPDLLAQRFEAARPLAPEQFPLAVWLQSPHNARRYREIGINLYVGLYQGPTRAQLQALDDAAMPVICHQNELALGWPEGTIVAWMHGDEPDNAQPREGLGYGPPIAPAEIVAGYEAMKKKDARPVLLNLGQGVAWDGWHGRGPRTNHPEDYPEYCKGGEIVSFDIYPVVHTHADVKGRLEFVGRGVRRLRRWTRDQKPVWACIETSHIHNPHVRPTPLQIRREVWQAIACGADGIIYFAHEFAPKFVEAGLLAHHDVREAVAGLNREVQALAGVLNSPPTPELVAIEADETEVAVRVHRHDEHAYLFVASLQREPLELSVRLRTVAGGDAAVIDADADTDDLTHELAAVDGRYRIALDGYAVRRIVIPLHP